MNRTIKLIAAACFAFALTIGLSSTASAQFGYHHHTGYRTYGYSAPVVYSSYYAGYPGYYSSYYSNNIYGGTGLYVGTGYYPAVRAYPVYRPVIVATPFGPNFVAVPGMRYRF